MRLISAESRSDVFFRKSALKNELRWSYLAEYSITGILENRDVTRDTAFFQEIKIFVVIMSHQILMLTK